jgi:hypothetical protein
LPTTRILLSRCQETQEIPSHPPYSQRL